MADRKRILIADDDPDLLDLLKMDLSFLGYDIHTATNGREAIEIATKNIFDLVLLDVMMPFVDGYHVSQVLSEKFPDRKILLLTSRDYDKDKMAIQACGADAHMSKPFDTNELLRLVNDMVGR